MLYQCHKCGQKYDAEQSGEYQCQCGETFTIDTTQAQCPFCKSPIPADAKKCAHCGEWINKPKSKLIYFLLTLFLGSFGVGEMYVGNKFFYCVPTWIIPLSLSLVGFVADKEIFIVCYSVAWIFSMILCFFFLSSDT